MNQGTEETEKEREAKSNVKDANLVAGRKMSLVVALSLARGTELNKKDEEVAEEEGNVETVNYPG